MENKKVDVSISIIRLISMILIISCHILQGLKLEAAFWVNVGVQMFFFISGFLYGTKDIDDVKSFYKKRFKRIIIPYIIILIIMLLMEYIVKNKSYAVDVIIGNLLGLQSFFGRVKTLTHTWFISYIIICYAITPIIQKVQLNNVKGIAFVRKLICICLFISILSYFKVTYIIAPWICNYIIGYFYSRYFKKYEHKSMKFNIAFVIITLLLLIFRIIVQYNIINVSWPEIISNNITLIKQWSHVLLGCSICIILYKGLSLLKLKYDIVLKWNDKVSYCIYLVHQIFILYYFSLLKLTPNLALNIIIIFVASILSGAVLYFTQMMIEKLGGIIYNKAIVVYKEKILKNKSN